MMPHIILFITSTPYGVCLCYTIYVPNSNFRCMIGFLSHTEYIDIYYVCIYIILSTGIYVHTVKSWIEALLIFNFRISERSSIWDKKKIYVVKIPWNRIFACFYSNRAYIWNRLLFTTLRYVLIACNLSSVIYLIG